MKRLVIVTDAWHPQVNGVVRVTEAQRPHLERLGYELVMIEPSQFRTIPLPFYKEIPLSLFPYWKVRRLMRETRPDAIHIATEGPLGWAARRVCMQQKLPFTTWYHTNYDLYVDTRIPGLLALARWFLRRFHAPATRTLVSTPTLKHALESYGFAHVAVSPLGVDTEHFTRHEVPDLPNLKRPIFAYVGRLATEKNPDEFFRLNLPGSKLVIGDGPERPRLETLYGKEAMFVGYQRGKALAEWISRADVLVFPSRTETFGLVQLEAMACGVPVAAHDVMGPRDIITPGKDGYLSDDLGDAARKCLTLKPEDCRTKALQYSWAHSSEAFAKHLASLQ